MASTPIEPNDRQPASRDRSQRHGEGPGRDGPRCSGDDGLRRWARAAIVVAHAVLLAACGGGGGEDASVASQLEAAPQPAGASAPDAAVGSTDTSDTDTTVTTVTDAGTETETDAAVPPDVAAALPDDFGPRALTGARMPREWADQAAADRHKLSNAPPHPVLGAYTWAWRPSNNARCGNGTTTGYAISFQPGSDTLLVYLQGGGACWGANTCYGLKTSKGFLETKQEAAVRAEVADTRMAVLFDRGRDGSLLADMSHAYIPYCTGDLHAGTRAQTHKYLFRNRPAHHVGALNLDAFLADMVPLMGPSVRRVVLVGASAGGFGASMNWWRVRQAFGPGVQVDVLDDSGPMIDPSLMTVWRDMRNTWGLRTPPGCTNCGDAPSNWLPFYARTIAGPERYAVIAHEGDDVIGQYTFLSDRAQARRLRAMRDAMAPNQKAYLLPGDAHVALDDPAAQVGGVSVGTWVTQLLRGDPAWAHAGP